MKKNFNLYCWDRFKLHAVLFIAFILVLLIFSGCNKDKDNFSQLLVQNLKDVALDLEQEQSQVEIYLKENSQEWSEYFVYELANMISLQTQYLADMQNEFFYADFKGNKNKWEKELLPFLKAIKEDDIITFTNNMNKGLELAAEGKTEEASDIFIILGELLPKVPPNKAIMEEDIRRKLLNGCKPCTFEEAEKEFNASVAVPKNLPERFEDFGIFSKENPGMPDKINVRQIWYDSEKFELLVVNQWNNSEPEREEEFIFTTDLESAGTINNTYPWANYRCIYEFTKEGIRTQGFMLVNDKDKLGEYTRLLKSLKEES